MKNRDILLLEVTVADNGKAQYQALRERSNNKVIGKKFGRLYVKQYSHTGKHYHKYFLCLCDCGNEKIVDMKHLVSGKIKSCGCLWQDNKHEYRKIHGDSKKSLYIRWLGMKGRCENRNNARYKDYGGRGIAICEQWHSYESFKKWALKNDYKENLEIDRIDNNKGYSPSNCRFVTAKENNLNKRNNIRITYQGKTLTISEWAKETGIKKSTISARIKKLGWSPVRAITEKV